MPYGLVRCVIIDDEEYAIELLIELLQNTPNMKVINTYSNPLQALAEITKDDRIDIIFSDIDMPGISGINLASKLKDKVGHIVFITAYPKYALQAFEVKASNYLLKPVNSIKFMEVINEINQNLHAQRAFTSSNDVLFMKPGGKGKFASIKLNEIILIQAEHNHLKIITESATYTILESMKNICIYLDKYYNFVRIHKTYMINVNKILTVEGNTVKLFDNYTALISGQYRDNFISLIEGRIINSAR